MSNQSERRAEHRRTHDRLRQSERRLSAKPMEPGELSKDTAYLQTKLAAKKTRIRALEAKIKRMERVWRSGGTWDDFQRVESERAEERALLHQLKELEA